MESRNVRKSLLFVVVWLKKLMFVLSGQAHNRDADNKLLIKDPLAYIKSSNKNLQNTSVVFFFFFFFVVFSFHSKDMIFYSCVFQFFFCISFNWTLSSNLAKTAIKINFLLVFFYFFQRQTQNKRVLLCGSIRKTSYLLNVTMEFLFLCHRTGNKNVT